MIPTRKELKLIEFAECVLARLENDEEWSADTTDDIATIAYNMGLAETGEDGMFHAKEEFNG
jgi:hypothetical protein